MAIQIDANKYPLSTDEIRLFLRDQPEYNILLDDIEFEDKDINNAMRLTVAKWNAMPPITNVTTPDQLNEYVLLCGVCGFLLKSEGLRQVRNQMVTQDGNISQVGIDEKEAIYFRWATHFQSEFKEFAQRLKIAQNVESLIDPCMSGFSSGYRYIGRWI
jgi:hypothetical protein